MESGYQNDTDNTPCHVDTHRTLLHAIRTGNTWHFRQVLQTQAGQLELQTKPDNLVFFTVANNRVDILDVLLDSDLDFDVLYRNVERLMSVAVFKGHTQVSLYTRGFS